MSPDGWHRSRRPAGEVEGCPSSPLERGEKKDVRANPPSTQVLIREVCDEVAEFLLEKNKAYGDSAADPVKIFSKVDALEQINVRIDDKLSRLARGSEFQGDDTELDLIGYLILKRVLRRIPK